MKFNYTSRTKEGQIQKGVVEAASEEAALLILQKYNLFVTLLEVIKPSPFYEKEIRFLKKISHKDIVLFARQLSILFSSQVPIVEALTTIARQSGNAEFREKIIRLSEEVEGGTTFSSALSIYPKLFSPFFISIVKSGEASGKLSEGLDYLADHLEQEYNFKNKITGAMVYPLFILVVFTGVLFLMMFVIMPSISQILKETGQELPLITKFVMALSEFLRKWGLLVVLFIAIAVFLFVRYIRTPNGKESLDKNMLKWPLIGGLLRKIYLTRFAENLSTLISGGLPIARALEISGEVVENTVYKRIIFKTRDQVRTGELISNVLGSYQKEFPPLFIQMIVVGEKTGRMEKSLANIVSFYQKDVNRSIDGAISLLEPLMIIILALLVTGLLASVLLPIYQMGTF